MPEPRKLQLSPTRIATFLACRVMYKYDYIDRIGKFYHKSRAGSSFGATLHQALQEFHEAGGTANESADDLTARAMSLWRSAGFTDAAEEAAHKELAGEVLQKYHLTVRDRADKTHVFLTEKMVKYDMGDFVLSGRVDRIDEHVSDGALEIIDFKSGRSEITEEDVRAALAMSIYQLIVKRLYPDRRVFATITALRSGVSASAELSDEELAVWEDDLIGIGKEIIEKDWDAVRPIQLPDICPDCDFLSRCSKYWEAIERRKRKHDEAIDD
jgi:putative RecB family exonuclease